MIIKLYSVFFWAFFVFIGVVLLIGVMWAVVTEKRLKKFFLGKKAKDLEETIGSLENNILTLKKSKDEMVREIETINGKLKKSVRGVGVVRFNPFPDQGSNQSFAIGLLDEDGDGIVLSSLYSRDRMSVFAKPVKNKKSEYELSSEEKEALKKAEVRQL